MYSEGARPQAQVLVFDDASNAVDNVLKSLLVHLNIHFMDYLNWMTISIEVLVFELNILTLNENGRKIQQKRRNIIFRVIYSYPSFS